MFFIVDIYEDCLKVCTSNEYHYRKYYTYIPLPHLKIISLRIILKMGEGEIMKKI